jgi:hypothetical protein
LFLRRNPEVAVRQSEGVSLDMNITEVKSFFGLLWKVMGKNNLLNLPGKIFNVDESGLHFNNKGSEEVIVMMVSSTVPQIISGEKGETVTILACCSVEGTLIPPFCIF